MGRRSRQVYECYWDAIERQDIVGLMEQYAEDAILVTLEGAFLGRKAIQEDFYEQRFERLFGLGVQLEEVSIEADLVLVVWSAQVQGESIPTGVVVFLIQDDLIQRQAEWFIIP